MENSTFNNVYNIIILDESGSMESIKRNIIEGFNTLIQGIKDLQIEIPNQKQYVTFFTFNSRALKEILFMRPINEIFTLNGQNFNPNSYTPLYDAIGTVCETMKSALYGKPDHSVLVTILTDGEENSSRKFTNTQVKSLIEDLKNKNWTFTYIGTDHDIARVSNSLSIENSMTFTKSHYGVQELFEKEVHYRKKYNMKIHIEGNKSIHDFYDD